MKKNIEVWASILGADLSNLKTEIKRCEQAGIDGIHVDVMDGHFVPNITMGPVIIEAIRPLTRLPIEAHLMIENPWRYIDDFMSAGSDVVSLHVECYGKRKEFCRQDDKFPKEVESVDVKRMHVDVARIKGKGKRVLAVVNPGTPLCFNSLLKDVDGVLVMSVNPGFAGQKFMPAALSKISDLRNVFAGDIAVDGGLNDLTAPQAVKAGANVLATASYFFKSQNPAKLVESLKGLGD